jgi:glycosyltransferase involved in cell wall biosynthesis
MSDLHPYREKIQPVPEGTRRPLWSVMIPTYNCANYLRETLASVLAQDPGPEFMQIEVVDDHSTHDDPGAVVEELGSGRVGFYQQPENVGHTRNFETCLQRSRGKIIHLLHGDDCVRYGFYRQLQHGFEENPSIGAAFCRHILMDEQGHWSYITELEEPESGILSNWLERIALNQRIQTPSIVVRRDVYEEIGGFDRRFSCWGEDWEMWVRIAARYPMWYEVEPLALYRIRSTSLSGNSVRTGKNIRDFRKGIEIVREYLPSDRAHKITQKTLKHYALFALGYAEQLAAKDDSYGAMNQIREALLCRSSLSVIVPALMLGTKLFYCKFRDTLRNFYLKFA